MKLVLQPVRRPVGAVIVIVAFLGLTLSVPAEESERSTEYRQGTTNEPAVGGNLGGGYAYLLAEHLENLTGGGFRIESPPIGLDQNDVGSMYVGMDLNYLRNSDMDENAFLSFIIVGLHVPWRVSPYVEGGISPLAALLVVLDANDQKGRFGSSFVSAGVVTRLPHNVTTRVYYKSYYFHDHFGGDTDYGIWGWAVGIGF
jgi:hypothetical protein